MKCNLTKKIILWGGTGQAKVIRPIVEYYNSTIDAVFDDTPNLKSPFDDIKLYHGYKDFLEYKKNIKEEIGFIVTIGNNKTTNNQQARIKISNLLKKAGLLPITIVHPTAFVDSNVEIGEGVQISAGANIISESKIGNYCIIKRYIISYAKRRVHVYAYA